MSGTAEPGIGHNSVNKETALRLKSLIDRVENLETEKKSIADDIKDVKAEAKSAGYDMKAFNNTLKIRKRDAEDVKNETGITETYLRALGNASYLE